MAAKNVKSITTFSDNCAGQNRNRYFLTMLWYSLKTLHLDNVCQKYLERGHTQNENDSVHLAIESSCKHVNLYTTSQWATCMQVARRSNPYYVTEMISENFFDFKHLSTTVRKLTTDTQGSPLKWMQIKTVSFYSQCPDSAIIQYNYDGPYVCLNLKPNLRNSDRMLPVLKPLFRHGKSPNISKAKYNDLRKLCQNYIVPRAYKPFYENLPVEDD